MAEETKTPDVEWLDFEAVMARLKLTRPEIYRQVKDGKLKGEKKEDLKLHFTTVAVDEFDQKRKSEEETLLAAICDWETRLAERFPVPEVVEEDVPTVDTEEGETVAVSEQVPTETASEDREEEKPEAPAEVKVDLPGRVKGLVQQLLGAGIREEITDLYIDPLTSGDRILFRYGDALVKLGKTEACLSAPLRTALRDLGKLTTEGDVIKRRGMAEITEGDSVFQVLIEVAPTRLGDHVHVHFWGSDTAVALTGLGYTEQQADRIVGLLDGDSGFVLIARGVGAADDLNHVVLGRAISEGNLVVSCETGIFPKSEHLVQVVVDQTVENGFGKALDTALGLEPDVLMVDLISKPEDLRALFSVLSMGGVVVVGVRALDISDALRIFEAAEIAPALLNKWLSFGVERVMMRQLCPNCKTARKMATEEQAFWEVEGASEIFEPAGCDRCQNGYLDRRGIFGLTGGHSETTDLGARAVVRQRLLDGDISIKDAREIYERFDVSIDVVA